MWSRWFLISTLMRFALVTLCHHEADADFLNIYCGFDDGGIKDQETNLTYISDAQYVESGEIDRVSDEYASETQLPEYLRKLRSFPGRNFSCYMLKNLTADQKYLVRATFEYGNYDGKEHDKISFDLYLDGLFWTTVSINKDGNGKSWNRVSKEVLTVSRTSYVSVCLKKTNEVIPFISLLELRPLRQGMYPDVNRSTSLNLVSRFDMGGRDKIRYPSDPYDRIWDPDSTQNINKSQDWNQTESTIWNPDDHVTDVFEFPTYVMSTAVKPTSENSLYFSFDGIEEKLLYIYMGFAGINSTELSDYLVTLNGQALSSETLGAQYLISRYTSDSYQQNYKKYDFSLAQSANSPPRLNAVEFYAPINFGDKEQPTSANDFDALMSIKQSYSITKNWMGDPCLPRSVNTWYGISCNYSSSGMTVIQKLNLSSSNLTGNIDASFGNLTSIDSLDLSRNSLQGPIPEFFGNMPSLRVLNLSGNQLSGLVPHVLLERSQQKLLELSIEGNHHLCLREDICKKNKGTITKLSVLISLGVTIVLLVLLIGWLIKRSGFCRRHYGKEIRDGNTTNLVDTTGETLQIDVQHFTYKELQKITSNFEHEIGKGGFGTVYSGQLYNGTQVAVKVLNKFAPQGSKLFLAEVRNLSRVHHRSIVDFIGYCKDGIGCLALVYEYMSGGSLCTYLRGKNINNKVLNWEDRLRILLEASQGLLYLHRECNPAIIHRDVKAENILLNEKLEAKIADFGLSKDVQENCTHISTTVAGTLGYLDPEYQSSFQLTEKSDIYSFGVVLLEMITAMPPIIEGLIMKEFT